ncbi:unnamed protein product, partial [Ectocarpus sp. 12 AP-2014]
PCDRGGHVREVRRGRAHHGARRHDPVVVGLPALLPVGVFGGCDDGRLLVGIPFPAGALKKKQRIFFFFLWVCLQCCARNAIIPRLPWSSRRKKRGGNEPRTHTHNTHERGGG